MDDTDPAPSQNCVSWMCAPGLVWARDTLLDLEVWTYYSTSPVPAWKNCVAEQREQIAQAI